MNKKITIELTAQVKLLVKDGEKIEDVIDNLQVIDGMEILSEVMNSTITEWCETENHDTHKEEVKIKKLSYEQRLCRFAEWTLCGLALQADEDWNSDTIQEIGEDAIHYKLAKTDEEGFFKLR